MKLKQHHHVKISTEARNDLKIWEKFLKHPTAICQPFSEFAVGGPQLEQTSFHTDASLNAKLGCGGWCESEWFMIQWNEEFIHDCEPSIAYLESYALTVGVLLWAKNFRNRYIVVNCDNQSVVQMINNTTSICVNCMVLICVIVKETLVQNVRIFARYVNTKDNDIADALSRLDKHRFERLIKSKNLQMASNGCDMPHEIWPVHKVWRKT